MNKVEANGAMLGPFFSLAMLSISRQKAFRSAVIVHLVLVGAVALAVYNRGPSSVPVMGQFLLVAGIVEGAVLIGWRLTQMPKSQALEFLLVSPLRPRRVFIAETLVGLARLALVTLAGLPILALLVLFSRLELLDLGPFLLMPFTWGAITGLGLTVWAYEPLRIRRIGERAAIVLIVFYLVIGVLVGEKLPYYLTTISRWGLQQQGETGEGPGRWFGWLVVYLSSLFHGGFEGMHLNNPFAVMDQWTRLAARRAIDGMIGLEIFAASVVGLLMWRASGRLKEHFQERHYRPILDPTNQNRGIIGERPLSWWAVRRVSEYSGRVNLWLAGGFGLLYAAFLVAGDQWPDWMGMRVFQILEHVGGVSVVATGLVVLAAVPAAFQYGLWDSNNQDRCRRLELLLLTGLDASDYWDAAAAAAWRRGRGYFFIACILWTAAFLAGRMDLLQVFGAFSASVVLWGLYFAVGFRAFSRGTQANGLGSILTLGLPLLAMGLTRAGSPAMAALVPPGSVYYATDQPPGALWPAGAVLSGVLALLWSRHALKHCDQELRQWYDLNHGSKLLD
ncbi:MAG: hypothetical protein K2R98_07245 [Gemmataceae bacterium]|nr:hypothetical protein [Gemmataceae bacterium]